MKSRLTSYNVRCPKCHKVLCKRYPFSDESNTYWGLHIKHRKLEVWTEEVGAVFRCPSCDNRVFIDSRKGILNAGRK